jgi:phosphoglycerol transferase
MGLALLQALLIASSLFVYLHGWRRDFRLPLGFSIDSLFYLMQSKSTVDNGWWWFNSMLGAPFGFDELAFPSNTNVDQAIVWVVSRFISQAITAINVAWMMMIVLGGWSATWCFRRMGVSATNATMAGVLFALSPYALYRNVGHLGMATYLVPFVCTAALQLASGHLWGRDFLTGSGACLLVGCALLGFNYVYYPFFGSFFVCVAALVGYLSTREPRILRAGTLCLAVLVGCTLLNLAPSLVSWSRHGKPILIADKMPAESEIYGLKIRTLISPLPGYVFAPFRAWTDKEAEAQFPLETENSSSRLGLVGTLGFVGLLSLLLMPWIADRFATGKLLFSASQLTIAGVLLATIGGFGSLFSLIISPQIRAYNRICPFIEFFALGAVALVLDAQLKTRKRRLAAAGIVLALGLSDQGHATAPMNAEYTHIVAEVPTIEAFVSQLEKLLPDGAKVLQLPFRTYLNDTGFLRMQPYDHFKLYLLSHRIRWSYPALSNEQVAWQQAAASLPGRQLPYQLAREGFAAIVIDRYGYADAGAAITAEIRGALGERDVIAQTARYVAFDIRSPGRATQTATSALSTRLLPATLAMVPCGGQTLFSIDRIDTMGSQFHEHTPRVPHARAFRVTGWAADQRATAAAAAVDIVIDRTPFPSVYGLDRADVARAYGRPSFGSTGFTAEIPADSLAKGKHLLSLRVVGLGHECYYETAATTLVVD